MKFKIALQSLVSRLCARRDDVVAFAKTLPARGRVAAINTTSRLGEAAVAVAAKLHAATTEAKRKAWLRRIHEWRQQVRIEELQVNGMAKNSGCHVVVEGKGIDKVARVVAPSPPSRSFRAMVEDVAEQVGVDVGAIDHYMQGGKPPSKVN